MSPLLKCDMKILVLLVAIAIASQISATSSSGDDSDSGPDHSGSEDSEYSEEGSPERTSYRQGGPWHGGPWHGGPGHGGGWHGGPEHRRPDWGPHHGFRPGSHGGFNPHSGYHPGRYPGSHSGYHPGSNNTDKNNSSHNQTTTKPQSKEEQIATCIKACPVTMELNPVCGTNNVTYPNPGQLQCEQKCGIDVQLSHLAACSGQTQPEVHPGREVIACLWKCPVNIENDPVCGSNNVTYANHARLLCEQACGVPVELKNRGPCKASESTTKRPVTPEDQIACVKSCPVTGEYNPVCGSNNVTYSNLGKLECARVCGIDVTLRRKSPCGGGSEVTSTTEKVSTGDESIAACIKSCPVTPEYNPVCGSNNVTYTNPGRLECAKHCGVDVTLSRKSPCRGGSEVTSTTEKVSTGDESIAACIKSCPVTPEYNPVCGSNNVTYTNPGRLECAKHCGVDVTLSRKSPCRGGSEVTSTTEKVSTGDESIAACIKSCPVTPEYNPVCGSNNVTYTNPGRLECAKHCGVDVTLSRKSPCRGGSEVTSTTEKVSTGDESIAACIKSCPVTPEYNPVCGSNNVTYTNPGRLECAKHCGVDVTLSRKSPCRGGSEVTSTTEKVPTGDESIAACIKSCPVTPEYNPVCGSNNVTYTNPGRLECAKHCGVDVTLSRKSPCRGGSEVTSTTEKVSTGDESIAACIKSCPVTPEYNPVCGSNNVTYTNPGRLECAKHCGVDVTLRRKSPCRGGSEVTSTTEKVAPDESVAACMRSCPVTSEYNPVCGSNNVTYTNPGRLECAQYCGVAVTIARRTTCEVPLPDKPDRNNGNKTDEGNGKDGNENENHENLKCNDTVNRKPPSLKQVMKCMQTCSLTSEYNPVCGSDLITYMNPGRLLCAQFCGVDVQVKKFVPCNSDLLINVNCPKTCTDPDPPVTIRPDPVVPQVEVCMEACPSSKENNPVCGSNNITYKNLDRLLCARRCGIHVIMERIGDCSVPEVPLVPKDNTTRIQECVRGCSLLPKHEPVCGTDNITYNSKEHLKCAKLCGLNVEIAQPHPCSPVTPPTGTTEKVPKPGNGTHIDPEILEQIWGTTTPKNDEDEDVDIDHRNKGK